MMIFKLLSFALTTGVLVSPTFAQQSRPVTAPATAPSGQTAEETSADARMQRMIFILDTPATPGERLRAMKLVEQVLQGEIAAISANTSAGGPAPARLTRYRASLADIQGRIKALEPTIAQQGLAARTANARIEALAALAEAQSDVAKHRAEIAAKQAELQKTETNVKTLGERLKEPTLTRENADALRRELGDQETKLKTQTTDLGIAKAAAATAEQALRDAEKKFQTDSVP
jgi:hypothetical protein